MAPKGIVVGLVLVTLAILSTIVTAQSGCTSVIMSMASCLSYVTGSGATPSPSCCSALANVVKTQPRCLCTFVNGDGGGSLGVNINQTRAVGMPSTCGVETPPSSRCNVVNGPAMSPVGSPEGAPSPGSEDGVPGSPSVTGSKATPSSGATSKGSTTTSINIVAYIIVFITASTASNYIL